MKRYIVLIGIVVIALTVVILYPKSDERIVVGTTGLSDQLTHCDSTIKWELPKCRTLRAEELVSHSSYTASYNREWHLPNWVAWRLTPARTIGDISTIDVYTTDPQLEASIVARESDFHRSGYDLVRMCPASDNRWSLQAMQEAFYLSNVCPQTRSLDKGDWKDLEGKCRRWAQKYGEVYIACGPIVDANKPTVVIGSNKVRVPDAFFKVVLRRSGDEPKAIGFIMENGRQTRTIKSYALSVAEVEAVTGITFFHQLPEEVARKVKEKYNWDEWK